VDKILQQSQQVTVVDPLASSDWDASLARLPHVSLYHRSPWARVLAESYHLRPLYLRLGSAEDPQAVLPLMEVKSVLTGKRGVSLPFSDECEAAAVSETEFRVLFDYALRMGRDRGWDYLECRGGLEWIPQATSSLEYYGHRVVLHENPEVILAQFHSSVRRAIRKAEQTPLTFHFSPDLKAVEEFYQLFCKTRQRHGAPPQPFHFYARIQRYLLETGNGLVALAKLGDKAVGGTLFLHDGTTVMMKFAASDLEYQHLRMNNLVLWESMRHYGQRGFKHMDFGRTSLANDGLLTFKRHWGAQERRIRYVRYGFRAKAFTQSTDQTSGWQVKLFQRMPLPAARMAGKLLYRHMA